MTSLDLKYDKYKFLVQEERVLPDLVYVCLLSLISVTALITHLPSLCSLIRNFRRPNNASLIYRNLFLVDMTFLLIFCPMDIFWSFARSSMINFRKGSQDLSHLISVTMRKYFVSFQFYEKNVSAFPLSQFFAKRLSDEASYPIYLVLRLVQLHHNSDPGQVGFTCHITIFITVLDMLQFSFP